MKNIYKIILIAAILTFPMIIFAQKIDPNCNPYTLKCLVGKITDYIQVGIYLIIALAVITFIWNVYLYFFTDKDKKEAGMYVLYSVIGFFVILSLWGLVAILRNSLALPTNVPGWPFGGQNTNPNPGNIAPPGSNLGNPGNTAPPGFNLGNPGNRAP
jgi:prepilin signal peptidase PulO-like enzyme (type II secretory pathway)